MQGAGDTFAWGSVQGKGCSLDWLSCPLAEHHTALARAVRAPLGAGWGRPAHYSAVYACGALLPVVWLNMMCQAVFVVQIVWDLLLCSHAAAAVASYVILRSCRRGSSVAGTKQLRRLLLLHSLSPPCPRVCRVVVYQYARCLNLRGSLESILSRELIGMHHAVRFAQASAALRSGRQWQTLHGTQVTALFVLMFARLVLPIPGTPCLEIWPA
jgi:hypothetical protein